MAITFTRVTQTHDPETDTVVPVTTTITGTAIMVRGDAERYKALGLVDGVAPTLLFTPSTYALKAYSSQFVQPGDTVDWLGTTYTVRDVTAVAPDGYVIISRIVVSR